MDASVRREINSCINELYSIARALESAADEVTGSIEGMNTSKYTKALREYAESYRKAASKLSNIK